MLELDRSNIICKSELIKLNMERTSDLVNYVMGDNVTHIQNMYAATVKDVINEHCRSAEMSTCLHIIKDTLKTKDNFTRSSAVLVNKNSRRHSSPPHHLSVVC